MTTNTERPLLRSLAPLTVDLQEDFPVRLRPIHPGDCERAQRAYSLLLSERSRSNRFWHWSPELNPSLAESLTDTDLENHIAWIALRPGDAEFPGYGGASFWRHPERNDEAEVGFTVADAWQRHGLATLLFSILWFEGWHMGLRRFYGFCRLGNDPMQGWWSNIGGELRRARGQCELSLELEAPVQFVNRVAYELPAGARRIELAEWLRLWIQKTTVDSE